MSGKFTRVSLPVANEGARTDWTRLKSLSDAEIDAAMALDHDSYAIANHRLGHASGRYHYQMFYDNQGAWRWRLVSEDGTIFAEAAHGFKSKTEMMAALSKMRAALLGSPLAA